METLSLVQRLMVWVLPVMLAIVVHELAHGWVARRLGDPTAYRLGRLSLNPVRHIDPVGSLLVPGIALWLGGVIFGWARPVPVDSRNLRDPHRDMALVALAGPLSNLLMAIAWGLVVQLAAWLYQPSPWLAIPLLYMGVAGIFINTLLMVVNLLPVPPLDGGRVAMALLPLPMARVLARLEPWGLLIVVLLLLSGWLGKLLWPVISLTQLVLAKLAGLPPEVFEMTLIALMGS